MKSSWKLLKNAAFSKEDSQYSFSSSLAGTRKSGMPPIFGIWWCGFDLYYDHIFSEFFAFFQLVIKTLVSRPLSYTSSFLKIVQRIFECSELYRIFWLDFQLSTWLHKKYFWIHSPNYHNFHRKVLFFFQKTSTYIFFVVFLESLIFFANLFAKYLKFENTSVCLWQLSSFSKTFKYA